MVCTKKLEEAAARLNKESESLNATLQKIQDRVNSLNIGLEVWADSALSSQDLEMREDERDKISYPFPDATSMAIARPRYFPTTTARIRARIHLRMTFLFIDYLDLYHLNYIS